MKFIISLLLLFPFLSLQSAETDQTAESLTKWMSGSDYQTWFDTNVSGGAYYPILVEGRIYNGKERYRAVIALRPTDNFYYYTHHGITDSFYADRSKKLTAEGYHLISHQTFTDYQGNTRHCATWVRNGAKPERETPKNKPTQKKG